ncbi:MAG TPA: SagB/ThcOx family dehydrogenase [Nitrososphaeraceae archaeon]
MNNKETSHSKEFHENTKHSEVSVQMGGHRLDFGNKPTPFKFYKNLSSIPLPTVFPMPDKGALEAVSTVGKTKQGSSEIGLEGLAELLFFTGGITRELKYGTDRYFMRAASATGALYPIELYVVCDNLNGLNAGVYHFNPGEFSLSCLRQGDLRSVLSKAAGGTCLMINSPVTIIFSSIAWRNAWKYRERSYRHWFWDSGVMATNLLSTANSIGISANLNLGFIDDEVNKLLCLDDRHEAAVALATLFVGSPNIDPPEKGTAERSEIPLLKHETFPLSQKGEVEYESIWRVHEASKLESSQEVTRWVNSELKLEQDRTKKSSILETTPLLPVRYSNNPSLGQTILKRGSSRKFSHKSISFEQLSNILHSTTEILPLDFIKRSQTSTTEVYIIANAVENLHRGSYYFNRYSESLELLKKDVHRDVSGYLCLWQTLFSDASVVFFLMTPLIQVLETYGNRGYRSAQFEAGIIAGKIYLSSYAQGIGASGSTFFDDAVSEFFSPHAKNKSTMIAVGVGVPPYESKSGKIYAGKWNRNQLVT